MRVFRVLLFVVALLFVAIPVAAAQEASPAADDSLLAGLGFPEIVITTDGTDYDPPSELEAGRYRLVVHNMSEDRPADVELYKVPEGMTFDDVLAEFDALDPEAETAPDVFFSPGFAHGAAHAEPGQSGDVIVDLTAGDWALNLFSEGATEEDDVTDIPMPLTVTGEMPEVDDPAHAVEVGMIEMEFVMPDVVPAGPSVWKVMNEGAFPHFIAIESYPEPVTSDQIQATLEMFFGPPASPTAEESPVAMLDPELFESVGGSGVLSGGNANWIEVDLEPGTYIAFCFISGPGDVPPHAALGMFKIFTVE